MKRKILSKPVTIGDLELSLKSELKKYATKDDLKNEIALLREENKQYKDEVLTKIDEIAGDLGDMREEDVIGSHQTSQLRQDVRRDVDNCEKRIKCLEKAQYVG